LVTSGYIYIYIPCHAIDVLNFEISPLRTVQRLAYHEVQCSTQLVPFN
jgi:hypothetical protein